MTEFLPIENYVPHRGSMLLIDRLLAADEERAVAEVCVPRDGLFLQDEGMPSWVGLEYMAQTVAAWAGWSALKAGKQVKLGFLLGTRKFEASTDFFEPGSILTVQVQCELLGDNGLGMFDCRIRMDGEVCALARVSVFAPEDASGYVQALEKNNRELNDD